MPEILKGCSWQTRQDRLYINEPMARLVIQQFHVFLFNYLLLVPLEYAKPSNIEPLIHLGQYYLFRLALWDFSDFYFSHNLPSEDIALQMPGVGPRTF